MPESVSCLSGACDMACTINWAYEKGGFDSSCFEGDGEEDEETSTVEATAGGGCGGGAAVRLLAPPPAADTGTPLVEMTGAPVNCHSNLQVGIHMNVSWMNVGNHLPPGKVEMCCPSSEG